MTHKKHAYILLTCIILTTSLVFAQQPTIFIDDNSNVGINTQNPTTKLQIGNRTKTGFTNQNEIFGAFKEGTDTWGSFRTSNITTILGATEPYGWVGTQTNDSFVLRTNNVYQIIIDTKGRMGIGTLVPKYELDVNGTVQALSFKGDGSQLTNLPIPPYQQYWTQIANNIYYTDGNVGINTQNPTTKLQIGNRTKTGFTNQNEVFSAFKEGSDTWGSFRTSNITTILGATEPYGWVGTQTNDSFALRTNNVYQVIIDTKGRMGIGINQPQHKVDVDGNVQAIAFIGDGSQLTNLPTSSYWTKESNLLYYNQTKVAIGKLTNASLFNLGGNDEAVITVQSGLAGNANYASIDFLHSDATGWGIGKDTAGNFYIDEMNEDNRLTIAPGGKIGIGTNTPSTTLDVDGTTQTDNIQLGNGITYTNFQAGTHLIPEKVPSEASPTPPTVFDVTFPQPFTTRPIVTLTAVGEGFSTGQYVGDTFPDTFTLTVRHLNTTGMSVNLCRMDNASFDKCSTFSQGVTVQWTAFEVVE